MTAETVANMSLCCVGDPIFVDYGSMVTKKEGYGLTGKGSNGLSQV